MNRDLSIRPMSLLRGETCVIVPALVKELAGPPGRLHHAIVGILWMICRSVGSELLDSLSTFLTSSPLSSCRGIEPLSSPGEMGTAASGRFAADRSDRRARFVM